MYDVMGFACTLLPGGLELRPVDQHPHAPVEAIGGTSFDNESGLFNQLAEGFALENMNMIGCLEIMGRRTTLLDVFANRIGY